MMKRSWVERVVYAVTQKPKHCVEVKNPPKTPLEKLLRPQDARQEQYNRWSRYHQIYSGSYLPYRAGDLSKQGWENRHPSRNQYETEHVRKSTGQQVLRHGRHVNRYGKIEPTHYHWINSSADDLPKKQRNMIYYFDKYGNECERGSAESHLKPSKRRSQK